MEKNPVQPGRDPGRLPFEAWELERSITERFERVVARFAGKMAVKDGEIELTYAELNGFANQLAHLLLAQGSQGGGVVGFLLEHGVAQFAAILSILKAGLAYLPLDPNLPRDRLAFMLADARVDLIVTNNLNLDLATSLAAEGRRIVKIDEIPAGTPTADLRLDISPDATANIIYTSGSTGEPKGVIQTHRNILHAIKTVTEDWSIVPEDRLSCLLSVAFVGSSFTFYGGVLNGATVMPFDVKHRGFSALASWLARERITVSGGVTSMIRGFASSLHSAVFPCLRLYILGGETIHRADVDLFRQFKTAPGCKLMNVLASTEALWLADFAITKDTELDGEIMPVGRPVAGKGIVLLDDDGRPVEPDEIGEIVVKSRYLSPGYLGRPDLTAAAFSPDPDGSTARLYRSGDLGRFRPDGCLVHLGRKDNMVKIRGHRVEIGEVENRLLKLDTVREAAVLARKDKRGLNYLAAYVVPAGEDRLLPEGLRAALAESLPDYMIPARFVVLDAMPHNNSGKIDRRALPDPDWRQRPLGTEPVPPRNGRERKLVGLFQDAIGVYPVGVRDDFFALGGDSLAFLALLAEIEREFGPVPPMEPILKEPTIEHLTELLAGMEGAGAARPSPAGDRSSGSERRRPPWSLKALVPYAVGAPLQIRLCGQPWFRRLFLRRWTDLVRQYLAMIANDVPVDEERVIQLNLACHLWKQWRWIVIGRSRPAVFARWVTASGRSEFEAAYREGRGVILAICHHPLTALIPFMLDRLSYKKVMMVAGVVRGVRALGLTNLTRNSLADVKISEVTRYGGQLFNAQRILEDGGIVIIAADGRRGASAGLELPFLGRQRSFKTGFAELAVNTGAAVIPAFPAMDLTGRIEIRFKPRLMPSGSSREERIESLVRRFAESCARQWKEDPGNAPRRLMRWCLEDRDA